MSGDQFKRENFPTDGGKSYLADWEGAGAKGVKTIEIQAGDDVSFEVPVQQASKGQLQQGGSAEPNAQMGSGDGFNWHPSEDLG